MDNQERVYEPKYVAARIIDVLTEHHVPEQDIKIILECINEMNAKIKGMEWELMESFKALPTSGKTKLINAAWKIMSEHCLPIKHYRDNE